jgi:hypothetical protein
VTALNGENKYQEWCNAYANEHGIKVYGRCIMAVAELCKAFPELTKVSGHVHCQWGKRGHAWAVDNEETIYDPTRNQFPGAILYEAWKPGEEVRWGVCMDCGDEIWTRLESLDGLPQSPPHAPFCSKPCEEATRRYLDGEQP